MMMTPTGGSGHPLNSYLLPSTSLDVRDQFQYTVCLGSTKYYTFWRSSSPKNRRKSISEPAYAIQLDAFYSVGDLIFHLGINKYATIPSEIFFWGFYMGILVNFDLNNSFRLVKRVVKAPEQFCVTRIEVANNAKKERRKKLKLS